MFFSNCPQTAFSFLYTLDTRPYTTDGMKNNRASRGISPSISGEPEVRLPVSGLRRSEPAGIAAAASRISSPRKVQLAARMAVASRGVSAVSSSRPL